MNKNKMSNLYDVVIIGASPCGMFSAYELMKTKKIAILDVGVTIGEKKCGVEDFGKCKYCKPVCNILGGFGGAQFFEGTKLSRYPAGTGLVDFCKDLNELQKLYDYTDKILEKMGKSKRPHPEKKKVENLKKIFNDEGIDFKYYNAQKVTKGAMNKIGNNIYKELKNNKVEIYLREQVLDIKKRKNNFIVKTNKCEYYTKYVIIAVGRIGSRQLIKIADKIGIRYSDDDQQIEIGVRVEMPFKVFDKVNNIHNDIKLKLRVNDNEELRSFCQDYKGYITRCVYNLSGDKIVTALDGHIIGTDEHGGKMSDVVNIAIHHRFCLKNSMKNIYEIISKFNHKGKPIVQTMKSFMTGNGSIYDISEKLSMNDVEYGDINKHLPLKTSILLKNFIYRIDRVLPGFANNKNVIYAPSFEMGWKKMLLNRDLETTLKKTYIGGDVTGHFRGAMQSAVSGIIIAKNILKLKK